jgi:hypothetical protein
MEMAMSDPSTIPDVEGLTVVRGPTSEFGKVIYQVTLQEGFILTSAPPTEPEIGEPALIVTENGQIVKAPASA